MVSPNQEDNRSFESGMTPDAWLLAEIQQTLETSSHIGTHIEIAESAFRLTGLRGLVRLWNPEIEQESVVQELCRLLDSTSGIPIKKSALQYCNPAGWLEQAQTSLRDLRLNAIEDRDLGPELADQFLFNQMVLSELRQGGLDVKEKARQQELALRFVEEHKFELQDCLSIASYVVSRFRHKTDFSFTDQLFVTRVESWVRQYQSGIDYSRLPWSEPELVPLSEWLRDILANPGAHLASAPYDSSLKLAAADVVELGSRSTDIEKNSILASLDHCECFVQNRMERFIFQSSSGNKIWLKAELDGVGSTQLEGWHLQIGTEKHHFSSIGRVAPFSIPSQLSKNKPEISLIDPQGKSWDLWVATNEETQ
jgi:hypothetical protein